MLHIFRKKSFYQRGAIILLSLVVLIGPSVPGHGIPNPFSKICNLKENFSDIIDIIESGKSLLNKYKKCDWAKNPNRTSKAVADLVTKNKIELSDRTDFCVKYRKKGTLRNFFTDGDQPRLDLACGL